MRCIIAFICRLLLLTLYVVLGRYEHEATPLDVVERAVVTCMQVCLLGVAWILYEACAFVVRALSRSTTYDHVLANDADPLLDEPDNPDPAPDACQSLPSLPPLPAAITFESRVALGRYIAKVHLVGVVVWTTMLSIDYALSQTSFVFLLGMLIGNVSAVLAAGAAHPDLSLCVLALYWGLAASLVLLYLARDGASALAETETELGMPASRLEWSQFLVAVNVLLSPASCGFSWTFWMDARTLLAHYRTSLYTSVLLSIPVLLFVRATYIADILAKYSPPWLAHVVTTEPVLKFMTIYVMTLSLDAESVVEMLVVNTCVVGICYVAFEPHDPSFTSAVLVLVACLLVLHAARLVRRAVLERRACGPNVFVVEDADQADEAPTPRPSLAFPFRAATRLAVAVRAATQNTRTDTHKTHALASASL